MQNALFYTIFLLIFSILGQVWLPWWVIMAAGFVSALLFMGNIFKAFIIAFLILGLEWFLILYYFNMENDFILATKIAELFQLNNVNLLFLISSLLAGIATAFSAATGATLHGMLFKK